MTTGASRPPLPFVRVDASPDEMARTLNVALDAIGARLTALERSAGQATYEIDNNSSPSTSLDASAATLADLRAFVATLAEDLRANGRLR